MISKQSFTTYAQYNEDIILRALLSGTNNGFYVDVGANYATVDSVTKLFYENGWTGINIEPIPSLHKELKQSRKRDINLGIGVGDKNEEIEFFENMKIPGHSSFSYKEASRADDSDIRSYKIKVKTLSSIFEEYNVADIHFLKVDVEGLEEAVLKGNDWKKYSPYVICIEANHRTTTWQKLLIKNDYRLFISDGLNEYYVLRDKWKLTDDFAERIVKLDYNSLKQHQYDSWKADSRLIKNLTNLNQQHHDIILRLEAENDALRRESLHGKSYYRRLLISARGLTIGWLRYIKERS